MTKSASLTNSQNGGDGGAAPWSDLDHNLLHLVMMKLKVFDFVPFSGVCKSWRSLALLNKTEFMASRRPMAISISKCSKKREYWLEGKFKTRLPYSSYTKCVGLTCGYLVLYGEEPWEFWLVNPVTRHGLHFPKFPHYLDSGGARAILVFSHSVSAWVFVLLSLKTINIPSQHVSFMFAISDEICD